VCVGDGNTTTECFLCRELKSRTILYTQQDLF
jgi:hypothetical protein